MFDRVDPSQHRSAHPFIAMSMNGDRHAVVMGCFDNRFQLFLSAQRSDKKSTGRENQPNGIEHGTPRSR